MGSICDSIRMICPDTSLLPDFHKAQPRRIQQFFQSNYFWATGYQKNKEARLGGTKYSGYSSARTLLQDQSADRWQKILDLGLDNLEAVFHEVQGVAQDDNNRRVVDICLSSELVAWRDEQHKAGRILPAKGYGITRVSDAIVDLLGVRDWPPPLLTNAALFGSGFLNFLLGAYDSQVLFSLSMDTTKSFRTIKQYSSRQEQTLTPFLPSEVGSAARQQNWDCDTSGRKSCSKRYI